MTAAMAAKPYFLSLSSYLLAILLLLFLFSGA
jgi:hypothetical protein